VPDNLLEGVISQMDEVQSIQTRAVGASCAPAVDVTHYILQHCLCFIWPVMLPFALRALRTVAGLNINRADLSSAAANIACMHAKSA